MAVSDNLWIGDLPSDATEDLVSQVFGAYGGVVACKVIAPKTDGAPAAALVRFGSTAEAQWVQENLNGNIAEGLEKPIVVSYSRNQPGAGKMGGKSGGGKGGGANAGAAGAWGYSRPSPYPGKGPYGYEASWGKGGGKGGGAPFDFPTLIKGLIKGGQIPGVGTRPDEHCVYIKNLPTDTTDFNLYELFAPFGPIAPQGVKAMLKEDGTCNSVGFVDFQDAASATAAVTSLHGTQLPDGNILHLNLKRPRKGGKGGKGDF